MKRCIDCGADISERGNRAKRCKKCQIKRNKELEKLYHSTKQGNTRINKQLSQWSKFVETLTDHEITVLIAKRMQDLKYAKSFEERQRLKTEIKILEAIYSGVERQYKRQKEKGTHDI